MSKKPSYDCIECGFQYVRWQGQCDQCGAWNSLDQVLTKGADSASVSGDKAGVSRLSTVEEPDRKRFESGFGELDRVLGGGWVCGSVNLICGEPGIGKSTIVLQSLLNCTLEDTKTLYVTTEESAIQVKHRAKRLTDCISDNLFISSVTEMEEISEIIYKQKPDVVVLDSIQMVVSHKLSSMPGSLNQVRLCASMFIKAVKDVNGVGILVGHITKDGQLAGPKMLEHMVDVILFFEGERSMSVRMLRSLKNRFGTTHETGLFKMEKTGLNELKHSQYLMAESIKAPLPGSVVTSILSGTRGILVELQSLVVQAGYQHIKRTLVGVDSHRAHLMIAILDKYFNLKLSLKDVFISLVGGFKTQSPDIDLAICFSILSSHHLKALPKNMAIFGEVGLTGEILPVTNLDYYVSSMEVLGITACVIPKLNENDWQENTNIRPIYVDNIVDAMTIFNRIGIKDETYTAS